MRKLVAGTALGRARTGGGGGEAEEALTSGAKSQRGQKLRIKIIDILMQYY